MNEEIIANKSKVAKYIASFLSVEVFLLIGGFISFPIFTRLLDKADYGLMSLISLTLLLIAAIGSAGLPHSVYRFHGKFAGDELRSFEGTMRATTIGFSMLLTIIYILGSCLVYFTGLIGSNIFYLLMLASPLILVRVLSRLEMSLIRVQERVRSANTINILIRYSGLFGSICMVLWFRSLFGYYTGLGLAELLVLIGIYLFSKQSFHCLSLDKNILKECFLYGFPLIFTALFAYLLALGDRYAIAYFMGPEDVADYSVAYNYCNYPIEVLRNTFMYSYVPVIMNSWNNDGYEKTKYLLTNFVSNYFWIIIPIIFGLSAISMEGIALLAGDKYSVSTFIVTILFIGIGIDGMNFIYTAELTFKKKTNVILKISIIATSINIALNIILIPVMGLMGAAIATLVAYMAYMLVAGYYSFIKNKFTIPLKSMRLSMCYGFIMYAVIMMIPQNIVDMSPLVIKITVGCITYFSLIALFSRSKLQVILAIFQRRPLT